MKDYKSLNKRHLIEFIILMSVFICCGAFYGVIIFLGVLEHYGIIHNTWTITNFSWFNLILSLIIVFCFIYFPIRSIIRRVRKYKRINNIVDNVEKEYKLKLEAHREHIETKEDKTIFLTEFKGKSACGKLLSIERQTLRHGYREYVLVAYKGKVMELSLPFDSVDYNQWDYNDGMTLLKKHLGKDIPLKILGKNIIIDWKKMYWDSK